MKFVAIAFIGFFSALGCASAQNDGRLLKANTLNQMTYNLSEGRGQVHVVVRKDGHLQGKPFIVELRPLCKGESLQSQSVADLLVKDAESACLVDESSLALSEDGSELLVKMWGVDLEAYEKASKKRLTTVQPQCSKEAKIFRFQLNRLCR